MEISVIIPVFNRAHLVSDTLQSVFEQSHRPIHLILVDNNSTDDTLSVLNNFKAEHDSPDFKVSVTSEHQKGAAAARNTGAALATSDWIMFFDSDDTMDPDLLQTYAEKIKAEGKEYDVFARRALIFAQSGKQYEAPYTEKHIIVNHLFGSNLATQRYIIRRSNYEKAGGWNPTVLGWNDWELGMRIILSGARVGFIGDEPRVFIHLQDESITGTGYASKSNVWEYALDVAEKDITNSNHPSKKRLTRLIIFRRAVLAGLYLKEGEKEKSARLMATVKSQLSDSKLLYLIFRLARRYVSLGGRGAHLIIRHIV